MRQVEACIRWHCAFCLDRGGPDGDRLFSTKAQFVSHFGRACHICSLEFTCPFSLSYHRSVHSRSDVGHVCNVCEATTETANQFQQHKETHRPYGCVGCGKVRIYLV